MVSSVAIDWWLCVAGSLGCSGDFQNESRRNVVLTTWIWSLHLLPVAKTLRLPALVDVDEDDHDPFDCTSALSSHVATALVGKPSFGGNIVLIALWFRVPLLSRA